MALLKKIVADKKDIAHEGIDQNLTFNSIAYHWSKARTGVQKEAEPVDDRNSNRIGDTRDNK